MGIARRSFKVEVPSVAMGDIAFNLLIFFVILARAQDDSHLKWNPAAVPKVEAIEQAKVRVIVDINHKLHFNGREIGIDNLAAAVQEALGDLPAGQRVVLLKIDKDTPAQTFEPIIEAVSEAGGDLVHVLSETKPEP
jgi:biopolymer transport protein ExbD